MLSLEAEDDLFADTLSSALYSVRQAKVLPLATTAKDRLCHDRMNWVGVNRSEAQLRHLRRACIVKYEKAGFAAFPSKSSLSYAIA